jgi:hypothetical protein
MSAYPHLFSPLRIGNVTVRNRIMQTAHVKLFAEAAVDSQRNVDYQAARAKGGAGLLITGNRVVHPTSTTGFPRVAWAYLREALEADRRLTDAVHEHGAVIFAQLNHFGLNATSDSADDLRVLWGPSAVKSPAYGETPKAMEHEDIREVVEWWGRSAELSREGGFDGTEVHISHSYLLHQFLSPLYNKRTDEYGGSFENRPVRARGDRRRALAGREGLGGRRAHQPQRLHRGRSTSRTRSASAQTLEADGPRLRQRHRRRLPQHLPRDQPSSSPTATSSTDAGEGCGRNCRCSPSAGSRIQRSPRRSSPRQGGHGRDDPRPDRRPGSRTRCGRAARTRSSTASAATRAASARVQRPADQLHGQPAAGREGRLRPLVAAEAARWVVAGGGRGDEGRRDAGAARATRSRCSSAEERSAGRSTDPAHARRDEFGWITRTWRCSCGRPASSAARDRGDRGRRAGLEPDGVIVATGSSPAARASRA